ACGGPPNYCARRDRDVQPTTPMPPPPVRKVFKDPDFGSRMVRVTDAQTMASFGHAGRHFVTPSSGEQNTWSKDSRKFFVQMQGGWIIPFGFDPVTMGVSRIDVPNGSLPLGAPSFGYTNPDVVYGTATALTVNEFRFSNHKLSTVIDTTTCVPGLKRAPNVYNGDISVSGTDQQFLTYEGGPSQDRHMLAVVYDKNRGCRWYNTQTGEIGGQWGSSGKVSGLPPLPPPPAPLLSSVAGGSLPPTTYYVQVTYWNVSGETVPSPEASIRAPANQLLVVNAPPPSGNAMAYRVYASTVSGGERRPKGTSSLPLDKKEWVEPSQGLMLTDDAPPSQNRSASYLIHNARLSRGGDYVRITVAGGSGMMFWQVATLNVTACTTGPPMYCGDHQAMGYEHSVNVTGPDDAMNPLLRPLNNLGSITPLIRPLLTPPQWVLDKHVSWNNVDADDRAPACISTYRFQPPYSQIDRPWDGEVICLRTDGAASQVWRFAHHRSQYNQDFWGTPRGNVSQDGKFYMFTSNWDNSLGLRSGANNGYRTDVFIVELH
ncbi:MAG TPA: hypothetical protein VN648_04905, partial [Candidatus Methylomirabilis sp.]|nr:hypothetical protein [Candidatus Methylomirabilis sp.]